MKTKRPTSMIVGPNRFGIGLDVGWRIQTEDGEVDLWTMNTQDAKSLASLILDAVKHGYEFDEVIQLENGKPSPGTGIVFRPKDGAACPAGCDWGKDCKYGCCDEEACTVLCGACDDEGAEGAKP